MRDSRTQTDIHNRRVLAISFWIGRAFAVIGAVSFILALVWAFARGSEPVPWR